MRHKLRIEALIVSSFDAAPTPAAGRGTVHGNESHPHTCSIVRCPSNSPTVCLGTCPGDETCAFSCGVSCVVAECTAVP